MAEASPMMSQYLNIKEKYQDSILFFRLGDFYEMFFDDAKLVSEELDLTLTGKDYGQKERAPMCGIPYHSCEAYIARLIAKGYKVAICDQVENPAQTKGLVRRDVVRVITPGTVVEDSMLEEGRNNFICCVYSLEESAGICFCDVSTGELKTTRLSGDDVLIKLKNELGRFCPREIIFGGNSSYFGPIKKFSIDRLGVKAEEFEKQKFDIDTCKKYILKYLDKNSIKGFEINDYIEVVKAVGALISYIEYTQKKGVERLHNIEFYSQNQYMGLGLNTMRNLEIVETMRNKEKRGSLLWVLDKTKTAMGKRLLRSWLERPLVRYEEILKRQEGVEELFSDIIFRESLSEVMAKVRDIGRLMTRIMYGFAAGREFKALSSTISNLPKIKKALSKAESTILKDIYGNIDELQDVFQIIEESITENPPATFKEGGIIKDGYSEEVDSFRKNMNGGKDIILNVEREERKKTGIPKLKVGYNKVFGYYIEVTNSYKHLAPEYYIRKQTLANCERYITKELKDLEIRILGAKDKLKEIEYSIFEEIRLKVAGQIKRIERTSAMLAVLDVLLSLATVAAKNNYIKPIISREKNIIIKESRHPVVEVLLDGAPFVPNNAALDNSDHTVAVITGPNMAGKSTYMRQIALIVLMAQIGSFVPAGQAEIGIVDNIFTRIGASDDLTSGQSTFMVEMNEVAHIVNNATKDSLLIFDEIGRGTSTFDGMSIARAVLEYVADKNKLGAKTLFATHYHELTSMSEFFPNVKNYNVAVKKNGDDIIFLRRIVPGGTDDSYGIEVAKLSGIPDWIINRAKKILNDIEKNKTDDIQHVHSENINAVPSDFSDEITRVANKLKNLDVSVLTPIESMNILFDLVKLVNN
ncbi:MAG: DNA mismatch repair protein MutS [Oscillospiraceae bacterium]|jgi:DNA mismatch repair protein MutS|nr:DNA mismatch repair protein MutS [Oscillospiraceae bacterium]